MVKIQYILNHSHYHLKDLNWVLPLKVINIAIQLLFESDCRIGFANALTVSINTPLTTVL